MPAKPPSATEALQRTPLAMRARLSAMIFLQYWSLGVWSVTVLTYLAENTGNQGSGVFSPRAIGYCLAAGAVGGLVAPALLGWIADRYWAAERLLAGLHALAAFAVWVMWSSDNQWSFVAACFAYYHFFIPTVSLTNTIALRHLEDADREFSRVRVYGTYAWITACWFVGLLWPLVTGVNIEPTATPLLIGAFGNAVMAAYSLTLPHTPPVGVTVDLGDPRQLRGLWRNGPFVAFLFVTVIACVPSRAYELADSFLNKEGYEHAAAKLTLGQISEIACMLFMPLLLVRIGLKRLFVLGVVGWCLRYVLLAYGGAWGVAWAVYLAIAVHGPSYAFVYIAGQLYVDRLVPATQRAAAQGWHTVASSGVGHLIGAAVVSQTQVLFLTPPNVSPPPYRWFEFWLVPAAISAVAAACAVLLIRRPSDDVAIDDSATGSPATGVSSSSARARTAPPDEKSVKPPACDREVGS